jgi:hypothetical protein
MDFLCDIETAFCAMKTVKKNVSQSRTGLLLLYFKTAHKKINYIIIKSRSEFFWANPRD